MLQLQSWRMEREDVSSPFISECFSPGKSISQLGELSVDSRALDMSCSRQVLLEAAGVIMQLAAFCVLFGHPMCAGTGVFHIQQAFPTLEFESMDFRRVLYLFLVAPLCPLLFFQDSTEVAGNGQPVE